MGIHNCLDIFYCTVCNLNGAAIEVTTEGMTKGKHSSTSFKNILPTLVLTFREKGGVNHTTFLCLHLFGFGFGGLYVILKLCPLFLMAFWYMGFSSSKTLRLEESFEIWWLTDSRTALITDGGCQLNTAQEGKANLELGGRI